MSNSKLMLDVGQANELKLALRRAEYTNEDVKHLCEKNGILEGVGRIFRGYARVEPVEYIIDCDARPIVPEGWELVDHKQGGSFKWHFDLAASLSSILSRQPVINACVFDFLFANPRLIPKEIGDSYFIFRGSVFHGRNDAEGKFFHRYIRDCRSGGADLIFGWFAATYRSEEFAKLKHFSF